MLMTAAGVACIIVALNTSYSVGAAMNARHNEMRMGRPVSEASERTLLALIAATIVFTSAGLITLLSCGA
ncbi:MAG: hypothetical protein AAFX81_16505 [Pseudomonadota bacterium]